MAQRILRPLDYGDIFDELVDLYKSNFVLFFGISAVLLVPVYTLLCGTTFMLGGIGNILAAPIGFIVSAAATHAVSECYLGRKPTIASSYRALRGKSWRLVWAMVMTSVIIGVGIVLLIIPGFYFWLWFAFVPQILMLEGGLVGNALSRSKFLVAGQAHRIIVVKFLCGIINTVISYVLMIPVFLLMPLLTPKGSEGMDMWPVFYVLMGFLSGLAASIGTPIQVISTVLLYYDIRVRKEAFDVEVLAAEIGKVAEPSPAGQEA